MVCGGGGGGGKKKSCCYFQMFLSSLRWGWGGIEAKGSLPLSGHSAVCVRCVCVCVCGEGGKGVTALIWTFSCVCEMCVCVCVCGGGGADKGVTAVCLDIGLCERAS